MDAKTKGRLATGLKHGRFTHPESRQFGEKMWNAKLTKAKVIEIRKIRADTGKFCWEIGAMFGVSGRTIQSIISGKQWTWVK